MIAFFCASPYQIFLALNMVESLKLNDVDIYIRNEFSEAKELVSKLDESNIFKNVYFIPDKCVIKKQFKICKFLQVLYIYMKAKLISTKYFNNKEKFYNKVFLTTHDPLMHFLINKLIKRNQKLEIHLFEDGIGNYYAKDFNRYINLALWKKLIYKVLQCKDQKEYIKDIYLVTPELVIGDLDIPIIKLPIINQNNKKFKYKLNNIFNYSSAGIIEKYIYIQQWDEPDSIQLEFINKILLKYIDKNDLLIKLHPRKESKMFSNFNTYQNSGIPWEIECLNSDMNEKVIISIFSTATISPIVLYNQAVKSLYLTNLNDYFKNSNENFNANEINKRFLEVFNMKSSIVIPNNLKELEDFFVLESDGVIDNRLTHLC